MTLIPHVIRYINQNYMKIFWNTSSRRHLLWNTSSWNTSSLKYIFLKYIFFEIHLLWNTSSRRHILWNTSSRRHILKYIFQTTSKSPARLSQLYLWCCTEFFCSLAPHIIIEGIAMSKVKWPDVWGDMVAEIIHQQTIDSIASVACYRILLPDVHSSNSHLL